MAKQATTVGNSAFWPPLGIIQITVTHSQTPIKVKIPLCLVGGLTFRRILRAKAKAAEIVANNRVVSKQEMKLNNKNHFQNLVWVNG